MDGTYRRAGKDVRGERAGAFLRVCTVSLLCACLSHAQSFGERDTGFSIELSQRREVPYGTVAALTTTRTFPCEGYTIRSSVTWEKDTVSINVRSFQAPSPCTGMGGEATGSAFLGVLRDTSYIRIYYRGHVDVHKVITVGRRPYAIPLHGDFSRVTLR